jgi:hypothetical protein
MAARKKATSQRGARKRRGASESMTGAKENEVEVRSIGDNSSLAVPEPDDWKHHRKAILGWREKVTTAQGGLRNAIKQAKKSGVDMKAFDLVVGIERQNDPAKTLNFFQQLDMGLSLSGETTIRITPHDTLAGDQIELVYKRGFADGEAGRTASNDYPETSDLAAEYARGWRHGTGKNLGLTPEQVDASEDQKDAA